MLNECMRTLLLEDGARLLPLLAGADSDVAGLLSEREVVKESKSFVELGAAMAGRFEIRSEHRAAYAAEWREQRGEPMTYVHNGFVLGWIAERAFDHHVGEVEPNPNYLGCLFRDVFSLHPDKPLPAVELEALIEGLWQRCLVHYHTLTVDRFNIDSWMERFYELHTRYIQVRGALAETLAAGDQAALLEEMRSAGLYDPTTSFMRLTASIRNGEEIGIAELTAALTAESGSKYERALRAYCEEALAYGKLLAGEVQ